MDKIEKLAKQAFDQKKLVDLLIGKESYYIPSSEFMPGYQVTNYGAVLTHGVYKIYIENRNIRTDYQAALLTMANANEFQFYAAVAYIRTQIFKDCRGLSPFSIEPTLVRLVGRRIETYREKLAYGITDTHGYHYVNALDDLLRWNRVTKENYNISLFSDEFA